MKKLTILFFCFLLLSCKNDDRYTRFPTLDISLITPDGYGTMNHEEFYSYFISKEVDSTIVLNQSNKIYNIEHTALFLQDSSNIYNNILLTKSPYFNLNQSTFKEIKKIAYDQLTEIYKNSGSIKRTSSNLSRGYYPYARLSFDVERETDTVHVTWYTINKQKESINIFVNNIAGSEYEEMIKTLL